MKNLFAAFMLMLMVLFLFTSCTMTEDKVDVAGDDSRLNKKTRLVKEEKREDMKDETVESLPVPKSDENLKDIIKVAEKKQEIELKKGEPFYDKLMTDAEKQEMIEVVLKNDTQIRYAVRQFAEYLKFNYLIDPQVSGSVTIVLTKTKMTKREVWEMFEQILWLGGAYCSPEGGVLHILPFTKMPQDRRILADHEPQANVEVMLLPIRNAASKDILEKIKTFITPGATAMDITHQNSILLIEAPANVAKIQSLVKLLDQKNKNNWPQAVIQCVNVSSDRIKNELASILPVLGFPVSTENIQAEPGSITLISLDRLQVVVATAANEEALTELKKWAAILDRSDVGEQEQVFIYKVVNSRADQLLSAISVVFPVESTVLTAGDSSSSSSTSSTSSTGGSTSKSSASPTGGASRLSASGTSNKPAAATTTTSSSAKGPDDKGPASVFDVPVKIFADGVHNRMVIRTTPRTYAMLRAVLERLDTVAAQVLLQVLVSEVTLTDDTAYGLEFSSKRGNGNNESLFGTSWTTLAKGSTGKASDGFKYLLTNKNNPDEKFAYLKAIAGKGKVKVLSSPQILVASHSEAKISVGDRVPIVTNQITDTASVTTTSTVLNSAIEYVDTGIILTITPHVTEGGLITMELEQIVSDAQKTTSSTIDSPTISERILKTALSIRDGGTVIVGGIIKEKTEENNQSIPFVSEINLLSKLFGNTTSTSIRTEMVVIITGRILDEHSNLDEITARYKQALKAISDMEKQEIKEDNVK
ncbi:MAG TPA: hypothetical protein DCZ94_10935 [Lentisphaeria bacterium]|nr:MAG: hypothetical protein A2X48_06815 [Lentisphaerae bacterium GWF2_49_21]HBC87460.1 hypothetical protein [Lentisphaeria bacterium]